MRKSHVNMKQTVNLGYRDRAPALLRGMGREYVSMRLMAFRVSVTEMVVAEIRHF